MTWKLDEECRNLTEQNVGGWELVGAGDLRDWVKFWHRVLPWVAETSSDLSCKLAAEELDLKQMRSVGVLIEFTKQPLHQLASAATWSPPCRSCDIVNAVASSNFYAVFIAALTVRNFEMYTADLGHRRRRGSRHRPVSKNVSRDLQYSFLFANKVCLFLLSRSIRTPHTHSAARSRFPPYRPFTLPSTMLLDLSLYSASASRPVYRRSTRSRQADSLSSSSTKHSSSHCGDSRCARRSSL
ncbi:hypothetical protein K438DRAFT_1991207 [Mycena galopus ATCC 62051]|nr:hypothetical protein K438DRAFT_1991207 [Mycena galopus ATCC 62051]